MTIEIIRETHDTPEWASRIITQAAGCNLQGDPLYRIIWGRNRLQYVGGKWTDRDPNTKAIIRQVIEVRMVPRYSHLGADKWFVERWYAPEHFGSRESWERQTIEREDGISIPALGPYPSRGDYDHFYTMEGPDGKFRQLTPGRVRWIASVIVDSELASKKEIERRQREAREQAEREEDVFIAETLKEAGGAFGHTMTREIVTVL